MGIKVEIRITVSNEGEIRVHGPIQDKILCYGLLEIAKDVIRNYKVESQQIIVPQIVPPQNIIGGN